MEGECKDKYAGYNPPKDKYDVCNPPKKCPRCGSKRLYSEVSVVVKRKISTERIYGLSQNCIIDNFWELVYCDKCGWCCDRYV